MKSKSANEVKIKNTLSKTRAVLESITFFMNELYERPMSQIGPEYFQSLIELRENLHDLRLQTDDMIDSLEGKNLEVTQLQKQIQDLQKRLYELETFEKRSTQDGGVFISYSHADKDVVSHLVKKLESDNINYWLDDKDLLVGQVIDRAISDGIQKSWIFITMLSPTSVNSRWVEREFDEASHEEIEGRKIILPVVCNNLSADKVPARVRRKLYVDLSKDFKGGYQRLKKSILFYLEEYKRKQQV